jgi:hypothetical protein
VGVFFLLAGCTLDRNDGSERRVPSIRGFVTGKALAALDEKGLFIMPTPRAPDDIPIISPARAVELAAGFIHTWGESFSPVWEQGAGGEVAWATLTSSPRVYFAATPFARFPDGFHAAFRRMFGPEYLVFFDSGDKHVLGVSVAAYSGDLQIEKGRIRQPYEGGAYFTSLAVGTSGRWPYQPITPEEAVAVVHHATGAQTVDVPELVLRAGWLPLLALWRISLDRPVAVARGGRTGTTPTRMQVTEIYVGPGGGLFVPSDHGPESITTAADKQPFSMENTPVQVIVNRRGALPLAFDEVTAASTAKP